MAQLVRTEAESVNAVLAGLLQDAIAEDLLADAFPSDEVQADVPLSAIPHAGDRVCPQAVISVGGRSNAINAFVRANAGLRYGKPEAVMVSLGIDTDVEALDCLPPGSRCRLGSQISAPALAQLLDRPPYSHIREVVLAYLLHKSGSQTLLGSNQVPMAARALAMYELRRLYRLVSAAVDGVASKVRKHSSVPFDDINAIVVVGTDNGAVGRGVVRLITHLARRAIIKQGAGSSCVLYHVALWGSKFDCPSSLGAAASEFTGAVETILESTGELSQLSSFGPGWEADGPDFTVVLPGTAFGGSETEYQQHAARVIAMLATPMGAWLAGMWRNR